MKDWSKILEVVGSALPSLGEFAMYIAGLNDAEWEDISKVWPGPTKTKMARIRAEAKAMAHFFKGDKQ